MKIKQYFKIILLNLNLYCIATEPFYIITQGKYQISFILKRKKIQTIMNDSKLHPAVKNRLLLLNDLKNFSNKFLGLDIKNQFEYYLEIPGDSISYLVIASEKLKLKPKSYWFPFVGTVYYIGFFKKDDAEEYKNFLLSEGFDVKISKVQAYSTLGWFSDPILSYHLKYSEDDFIRLILHEMTHNTYWKKDDNVFNENLAYFIETKGTIFYYEFMYKDQNKIKIFLDKLKEEREIDNIFITYKEKLNKVYNNTDLNELNKYKQKNIIFESLRNEFLNLKNSLKYYNLQYLSQKEWNNADFVLLNVYYNPELQNHFSSILNECNSDFFCFWKVLENNSK